MNQLLLFYMVFSRASKFQKVLRYAYDATNFTSFIHRCQKSYVSI